MRSLYHILLISILLIPCNIITTNSDQQAPYNKGKKLKKVKKLQQKPKIPKFKVPTILPINNQAEEDPDFVTSMPINDSAIPLEPNQSITHLQNNPSQQAESWNIPAA